MADEEEEYDQDDEDGGGGSKNLIIVVGVALFLIIGGSAAAYFTGLLQPVIDMISGGDEAPAEGTKSDVSNLSVKSYFKPMEDLIVNLNTGRAKSVFLNVKLSLELSSQEDGDKVELLMPRVTDYFQVYLRELRVEDLKGSAGMYRLREELLHRVRAAVAPMPVEDLLFKQLLIQ